MMIGNNQKLEDHTTRIFLFGLEMTFIFAIPAIIGAYLGIKLDSIFNTSYIFTVIILALTFIFSWAVLVMRYVSLTKRLREIQALMKKSKEEQ